LYQNYSFHFIKSNRNIKFLFKLTPFRVVTKKEFPPHNYFFQKTQKSKQKYIGVTFKLERITLFINTLSYQLSTKLCNIKWQKFSSVLIICILVISYDVSSSPPGVSGSSSLYMFSACKHKRIITNTYSFDDSELPY